MMLGVNHKGIILTVNQGVRYCAIGCLLESSSCCAGPARGPASRPIPVSGLSPFSLPQVSCMCCRSTTNPHVFARAAGVSKTLFGFEGQQLVGQPLSSVIDIFTDWKEGHDGDEMSLLELLVGQLMAATLDPPAGRTKVASGCDCWRVGVHRPIAADPHSELVSCGLTLACTMVRCPHAPCKCYMCLVTAAVAVACEELTAKFFMGPCCLQDGHHGTNSSSLLQALQPNRIQPACMKLEPASKEPGDLPVDEQAADTMPVLQVCWCQSTWLTLVLVW